MHELRTQKHGEVHTQLALFDRAFDLAVDPARCLIEALAAERLLFAEALAAARVVLSRRPEKQATTAKRLEVVAKFERFAAASGVEFLDQLRRSHVDDFIWSAKYTPSGGFRPVTARTAANRQSLLRVAADVLVDLGFWSGGVLVGAPIARGESVATRPATTSELSLIRTHAEPGLGFTRRSAIIALRLAGGSATDIAGLQAGDVDLGSCEVRFADRRNALDPWSVERLTPLVLGSAPSAPLCTSASQDTGMAAHTVTVQTRNVLIDAGLSGVPGLAPRSIELGSARARFGDDLIAGARFLGSGSLDSAAKALDIDWRA